MARNRRHPRGKAWERSALRRRARRAHRRETRRSGYYEPIHVDSRAAERGVNVRLVAGGASAFIALACLASAALLDPTKFTLLGLICFGLSFAGAAISLVMSARREEIVHQLASDLSSDQLLLTRDAGADPANPHCTDGSV